MRQLNWSRTNWILTGILMVQLGLAAWLLVDNCKAALGWAPGGAAGGASAQPLVANTLKLLKMEKVLTLAGTLREAEALVREATP